MADSVSLSLNIYPDELATAFKDKDYVKNLGERTESLRKLLETVATVDDSDDDWAYKKLGHIFYKDSMETERMWICVVVFILKYVV